MDQYDALAAEAQARSRNREARCPTFPVMLFSWRGPVARLFDTKDSLSRGNGMRIPGKVPDYYPQGLCLRTVDILADTKAEAVEKAASVQVRVATEGFCPDCVQEDGQKISVPLCDVCGCCGEHCLNVRNRRVPCSNQPEGAKNEA